MCTQPLPHQYIISDVARWQAHLLETPSAAICLQKHFFARNAFGEKKRKKRGKSALRRGLITPADRRIHNHHNGLTSKQT